ncbi:GMC oxidoreductase [Dissoconium aciculare CBS 342.82]|uniref:GMC oxidoreductase n=1 Tax=Dissoconium aciculare CBS 342.82 TaxID=1314786 RepID=A0A6J3LT61_9PEZI|nr:GMC oxidoreductase [Dissoconium aciculare CBS 342.82]KAF1818970.1 GMC oxidoreductase [Dissoconium aciculare CBS 342.82]
MMRSTLLSLLAVQAASFGANAQSTSIYDYIIVGGGTCGLVLANRLTENSSVTVAVVEAGQTQYNNPKVIQIDDITRPVGTEIDWQYPAVAQTSLNNRAVTYNAGKALGGTSTINGATYVRAQRVQIDAWESSLGNVGWNWNALWPYYLKAESLIRPTADQIAKGAQYNPQAHGYSGPITVSYSRNPADASGIMNQTYQALGVPWKSDLNTGDTHGWSLFSNTVNATSQTRADAATGYLLPVQSRKNLIILNGTLADRILWSTQASPAIATGVRIRPTAGGANRIITARREVILSAGSLKSPVLLENSGVGNPAILGNLGIPVKVSLPSVGENLQDQTKLFTSAASNRSVAQNGYWTYVAYPTAAELFGSNTSSVAASVLSQIPSNAAAIAAGTNNATSPALVEQQLRLQADLIFNRGVPCTEILSLRYGSTFAWIYWPLLPFSRGNVHIVSRDPTVAPRINPRFLIPGIDWDALALTGTANLIRKLFTTAPLSGLVGAETQPGFATVKANADVPDWMPWFQKNGTLLFSPSSPSQPTSLIFPSFLSSLHLTNSPTQIS